MEFIRLDKAVDTKEEDYFERYEFSKRIATLINKAKYPTSLVIGIYGKWGEGKSSVLNFISAELQEGTIKINFNPWYFQDDRQFIKSFFESIAASLGRK